VTAAPRSTSAKFNYSRSGGTRARACRESNAACVTIVARAPLIVAINHFKLKSWLCCCCGRRGGGGEKKAALTAVTDRRRTDRNGRPDARTAPAPHCRWSLVISSTSYIIVFEATPINLGGMIVRPSTGFVH